jgi:hypothetical protein
MRGCARLPDPRRLLPALLCGAMLLPAQAFVSRGTGCRARSCTQRMSSTEVEAVSEQIRGGGKARRAENVEGNVFVDESCIDCDTCRWMAPSTYARVGDKSAVVVQPSTEVGWGGS